MSLKKIIFTLSTITLSLQLHATPPVEILSACKNMKAPNKKVALIRMIAPGGVDNSQAGCSEHYERAARSFSYGGIVCNDLSYVIINGIKTKLSTAQNYSINPSIKPGSPITPVANWLKIAFNNQEYICIRQPLSDSGTGASYLQFYIIENAYTSTSPVVYYYFLEKHVMPLTLMD